MSDYTRRSMNWLLRELGVSIRPPGRPPKLSPECEREVVLALERGEKWLSIGARMGVSGNTILRIKRKYQSKHIPRGTSNPTSQTSKATP